MGKKRRNAFELSVFLLVTSRYRTLYVTMIYHNPAQTCMPIMINHVEYHFRNLHCIDLSYRYHLDLDKDMAIRPPFPSAPPPRTDGSLGMITA